MFATPIVAAAAAADVAASSDYVFLDSFESGDCSLPLTCPAPSSGKACIAGQLADAATTGPLHATFNVGLTCGTGAVGGPCDLTLDAYDAAQFASNPQTSMPLGSGAKVVDGCGRFRIPELSPPGSPYVVIAAGDAPASDGHVLSANLHALAAGNLIDGFVANVTRNDTVTAWSLLGQVDYSSGALLLRYTTDGIPTPGVTAIRFTAGPSYRYFTDTDAQRQIASTSSTSTGADGSVLVANAPSFDSFSGSGGETNGCHWTGVVALTISGVVLFADSTCIQ